MKLNIDFEHDAETGKERAVITDDRGDRMPGVRGVEIKYRYRDQATIAVIELVVNRSDVTLGHPVEPAAQVEAPEEGQVKLFDVRPGMKLKALAGLTCIAEGAVLIVQRSVSGQLYVNCAQGQHYLDGAGLKNGYLTGFVHANAQAVKDGTPQESQAEAASSPVTSASSD